MSDKDIIYELKLLHQWKLDRELVNPKKSTDKFFDRFDITRFFREKNEDISNYYNSQLRWHLAVPNADRILLAVLQENFLEIRHKRDDYQKPIGRISIPLDEYPQWRKLTWSSDGICVALSTTCGELKCYNALCSLICSIPKVDSNHDSNAFRPNDALLGLFLIDARTKNAEWPYELIAVGFNGKIRSYFISLTEGYKPYHTATFGNLIPTCAAYISSFNIFIVAFPYHSLSQESADETLGLSSWRLVTDYPYYRMIKPDVDSLYSSNKRQNWFSWLLNKNRQIVILKMSVSLNTKFLACMHSCGAVSVWNLPQLSMLQMWSSHQLSQYNMAEKKETNNSENNTHVLSDIVWCTDSKFAIFYNTGVLTVSDLDNNGNLLARINTECHAIERHPEFLPPPARLANSCDITAGFLILNHKFKKFSSWRKESESENINSDSKMEDDLPNKSTELIESRAFISKILRFFIHFEVFHQQKESSQYVERTYKLTMLKSVTPEELYEQKINSEEYAEALDFARLFNLDEDRVYRKQWLKSCPVTIDSIDEYLMKISDKKWIIHQCCERIPETLEAAEMLLRKGLEFTDFSEFILDDEVLDNEETEMCKLTTSIKFEINHDNKSTHFTKNQMNILLLRKYLLYYWDGLSIYKKILQLDRMLSEYDHEEYRKFRIESPLSLALNYAHLGNGEALFVLFTYYSEELAPYWLHILDNIPECIQPKTYEKLLPKFNEQHKIELWQCKRIRPAEWSESGKFRDLITRNPCLNATSVSYFSLSRKEITEWYEKKIREIVTESFLINFALELLNLASKNYISSLENLRHNLLVLEKLTYDLLIDENYTLERLERSSDLEKLILLMSEFTTRESFKIAIAEILLPFLDQCEMLVTNSKDALLDAFFKYLSEDDLMLPFIFFEYVTEKDRNHLLFSAKKKLELRLLCVYSCERTDQVDIALKIIEFEPEFSDNNNSNIEEIMNLRSRLTELHTELIGMQILRKYGLEKNITFVHANRHNEQFQKDTFTAMINNKIDVSSSMYELFDDMTYMQENIFRTLPNETYLKIFGYAVLTAGRADYIEKYASLVLCSSSARKTNANRKNTLTFNESVSVIVDAIQYYYDVASSYDDPNISLIKMCLSLITFHPDLERERKLIEVLKILNDFNVEITPLKVRRCISSEKLLEKVLRAQPKAYKNIDRLVLLATNLQAENTNRADWELEVLNLAVDAAFKLSDYTWCTSTILKLIEKGKNCWNLCKKLSQCEEYKDLKMKQKLVKYALMQCPDKELTFLVELRNEIECQLLQRKLKKLLAQREPTMDDTDNYKMDSINEKVESYQGLISISALTNMLQTSSSHVLNVNFWKNTFNFNAEGPMSESEQNMDVEHKKLILQQCLRYYLLQSKENCDDVSDTELEDVIAQLAIASFSDDCLFCLSLLMLFKDTNYSETVFSSLPNTIVVEKFALYYYSLKLLVSNNICVHNLVTKEPPSVLISRASIEAEKNADAGLISLINKYKKALEKRRKVNVLQDLGCGIDSKRFFNDETYKIDSILGLAMYEERDKLDLALKLGAEYNVSDEDIVLSHVKSLFLTGNETLLTERLKEPIIIDILKENSSSASEKLLTDVYDGINGCDHQILVIFYELLNQISSAELPKRFIVKMVLDTTVSTDVINVLLEFVRAGSLTEFITELLNTDLDVDCVKSLLKRIENCLEDNEYEKCWIDQLIPFLAIDSISKAHGSCIENILSILGQSDDDIYNAIEKLHESRLILRAWSTMYTRITLFDMISEESRLILFEKLVQQASSVAQFSSLIKMLILWPQFLDVSDWKKNPWMLLCEKVLALREDEIPSSAVLNLLQEIISHANTSKEMKRSFFEYMGNIPHNKILLVWFCILTNDDLLVDSVCGYIDELRETKRMPKKVEDHLKQRNVQ